MDRKILLHFQRVDKKLYALAEKFSDTTIEGSDDLFKSLCREIIGQQLSGNVANVLFSRFTKLFPNEVITPEATSKLLSEDIRNAGIAWAKVRSVQNLAEHINSKQLNLESLKLLDNEAVVLELTKIKGIGPWTAEMFLMFALGREDVFSPGDLGLRNAIQKLLNLPEKPTPQEALTISHKWIPYRTYASLILWKSIDTK